MRAAVIERNGEAPRIEDLRLDAPHPGEVGIRMTAAGVCHSDLHVRDGEWDRPGPIVMGHEGAGIVEAVGKGVDPALIGRTVALSWLIPCGRCAHCRRGREWACNQSSSLRHAMADGTTRIARPAGSRVLTYCGIGTMATHAVVPVDAAIPMPDGVPGEVAALIGCCVTTGVGAILKTAAVEAGSSVVVIGLGGVGLSAVMGAALAGARQIVAVDVSPEKLALAVELGATDGVLASDDDVATIAGIRDATDGGPDYAVEAIGRVPTIELAIATLPPGGTAVLIGMTALDERASFEVFPFVDGGRRIIGSNYGSANPATDFARYAELYLAGRLRVDRLIDRRLGLDELESAFDRLRRGEGHRQVIRF